MAAKERKRKPRTWATPFEAAEQLTAAGMDLSPYLVRRMCEAGEFVGAHRTPGGQWRIPRGAVEARARAHREQAEADRRDARAAVIRRSN